MFSIVPTEDLKIIYLRLNMSTKLFKEAMESGHSSDMDLYASVNDTECSTYAVWKEVNKELKLRGVQL